MTDYVSPAAPAASAPLAQTAVVSVGHRVSWGAIFAGVVIALVVQVLLSVLGLGLGVATFDPLRGDNPDAATFSIAAGIWYLVSGIIAALAGGYVAGRLSEGSHYDDYVVSGELH